MERALEKRVADLEKQVEQLRRQQETTPNSRAWVDDLYGKFANDPIFDQAMKLGRDYRKSLRPRPRKGKHSR